MRRFLVFLLAVMPSLAFSQSVKSDIRGFVYDAINGDRIVGASFLAVKNDSDPAEIQKGLDYRAVLSDNDGYYALTGLSVGEYLVRISIVGYDTLLEKVQVKAGSNTKKDFYINKIASMGEVSISVKAKAKESQVG